MPVTARLSQKFYEKFGQDITNELVDWFNSVDATYRADLRELNELNFARFDAKMGERIAELRTDFATRLADLDAKWENRWTKLDAKLGEVRTQLKAELTEGLRGLETKLLRWMFGFWVSTLIGLGALFFRG